MKLSDLQRAVTLGRDYEVLRASIDYLEKHKCSEAAFLSLPGGSGIPPVVVGYERTLQIYGDLLALVVGQLCDLGVDLSQELGV